VLVALVALQAGATTVVSDDPPTRRVADESVLSVSGVPGGLHLTLRDDSETPFAAPLLRLVALPSTAADPEIEIAGDAPPVGITALEPMILRGVKVLPVVVSPTGAGDAGNALAASSVEFEIRYREGAAASAVAAARIPSRGFFDSFLHLFPAGQRQELQSADEGGYLIVTAPEFVSAIQPLADWKREMGFEVTIVTTNETGLSVEQVQSYIRNLYQSSPVPPQYLLLVGDVEQLPGYDYHQSVSDLPFVLVDGDDFLPDMEVGRLSAQVEWELETMVSKILQYEQDPYRVDESWFTRALMVAGNYSSSTPVPVSRWCREQLLDVGYAEVDTVYYPPEWSTGPYYIKQSIDRGVSLVSYRGWAYGWQGWEPPKFTVDHIPGLENGRMLPAVFSFVCLTGNFVETECMGEAWLRAGTPTEPKGAVAFLGNSEHWSHTRHNDAAAIGAFRAIREDGVRRLGAILEASKYEIMRQFPHKWYYDPWEDDSIEFYFYIYSLLGDPSMEIWTAPPKPITVTHPASIPQGSSVVEVAVLEEDGLTPVAGARVGVTQGGSLLGSARTDQDGNAWILASFEQTGAPVRITVTGVGVAPYRGDVNVVAGGPYVALDEVLVRDDGGGASRGNGDRVLNPGEILELKLRIRNRGSGTATGASATLETLGDAVVEVGSVTFPDILPGAMATSNEPCVVRISEEAEDGLVARFRVESVVGGETSVGGFELDVVAPALRHESHALGDDDVILPGEPSYLSVTIRNDGSRGASAAQAVLRAATPALATVLADSLSSFPPVEIGETGVVTTPFQIQAVSDAAVGQAAVFTLEMTTDEGYVCHTSFSVILGVVDQHAPLGPDAYGYYAYDSSDTDYPDGVPYYDWITCSTVYGGSGTKLDLGDNTTATVTLPFDFTYYGETYNTLLVCDNGWASFDTTAYYDFYNWSMPNLYGNGAQLAPFWDNLDPTKEHEGELVGDGIYVYADSLNHRFVVEWSRLGNVRSQHPNRPDYDDLQTFELILFDPAFHPPTPTGDGIVRFQYKQIVNNDSERMYSTVGIENEAEDTGIEYTYTNLYPAAAAPLSAGLAIQFTTAPPLYDPFHLVRFAARPAGSAGVELSWEPCDERPRAGYRVYRDSGDGDYRLVTGGILGPSVVAFVDSEADPGSTYSYKIGSLDPVGREILLGPFNYAGGAAPPLRLALDNSGSNPIRGVARLTYSLPGKTRTRLAVYAASGRLVRTLVQDEVGAGIWTVPWDARDDQGRVLPNGVYFGRLDAGPEQRAVKLTLLR
jgi:hypothetical protein